MFSTEDAAGASFKGYAQPEGKRWYGSVKINGGHIGAYADTPEAALDAALDGWREAIRIVAEES